jgi:hypothetical protein
MQNVMSAVHPSGAPLQMPAFDPKRILVWLSAEPLDPYDVLSRASGETMRRRDQTPANSQISSRSASSTEAQSFRAVAHAINM